MPYFFIYFTLTPYYYIYLIIYIYVSFYACIEYDSFSVNFVERRRKRKNYLRTFSMAISNT